MIEQYDIDSVSRSFRKLAFTTMAFGFAAVAGVIAMIAVAAKWVIG